MPWLELHIATTAEYAGLFSDQLTLLGAQAVTMHDAANEPIYEPTATTPLIWNQTIVVGLFNYQENMDPILQFLKNQQAEGLLTHFQLKKVEDEDWVRRSMDMFQPMQFGKRLWICPSWLVPPHKEAVNIMLDPGLAFGTGTHLTTALCLEWLDANIKSQELVIDYGCGSGILGLAALKLGAKKVLAVDHDPQALLVTQENAVQNHIDLACIPTFLPNQLPQQMADLMIANILAQPLIKLASTLADLTKSKGQIVLSGILSEQANDVIEAYEPWFEMDQTVQKDEWVRLSGVKR